MPQTRIPGLNTQKKLTKNDNCPKASNSSENNQKAKFWKQSSGSKSSNTRLQKCGRGLYSHCSSLRPSKVRLAKNGIVETVDFALWPRSTSDAPTVQHEIPHTKSTLMYPPAKKGSTTKVLQARLQLPKQIVCWSFVPEKRKTTVEGTPFFI